VDLLDLLLQDEHEDARKRLLSAVDRDAPMLEELTFNVFEVVFDRELRQARVFDVLDGHAAPTVLTLDELRNRLA
jgi:hypothetical protein